MFIQIVMAHFKKSPVRKKIYLILITIFLINLNGFGQKRIDKFRNNSNFDWVVDSLENDVVLYYEKNRYAEKNLEVLKLRVKQHLTSTMDFVGIETYDKPIHYFILEDRQRMKLLVGHETNGNANPKNNFVTAIFSEKIKSVYGNHELFHLIAMNEWGYPETWINEGMAVYSDDNWHGYNLHELSKYLIDNKNYIPLKKMAKRLRKFDSMITYPLLGSFVKFIEEKYGRETTKLIWTKGRKKIKKHIGKSLEDLEKEWLITLNTVTYKDIRYLK